MINNQKKNNRILLVDNETDLSLAFKIALEDNGFEVDAFDKPDIALSYFNQGMYDLLLLDIKMPNMSGIEFYKRMKEIDQKVKVCFITASEIHYFEEIAKEIFPILGVRRLIRKPIKIEDLVKNLRDELKSNNGNNNYN
ncbi:MAG: response regulator [Nitrososphaeraceae archaeon]|nr:response regulator [Nitrososphaeraceae archaeon]